MTTPGVDALSRSRDIPPISISKVVLLSPHRSGTHVPLPAAIVVPGVASRGTIKLTTTVKERTKNNSSGRISQIIM